MKIGEGGCAKHLQSVLDTLHTLYPPKARRCQIKPEERFW